MESEYISALTPVTTCYTSADFVVDQSPDTSRISYQNLRNQIFNTDVKVNGNLSCNNLSLSSNVTMAWNNSTKSIDFNFT